MTEKVLWVVTAPDEEAQFFDTLEKARKRAEAVLDHHRDNAGEGWHEDVECIAVYEARCVLRATESERTYPTCEECSKPVEDCACPGGPSRNMPESWDYQTDYTLLPPEKP